MTIISCNKGDMERVIKGDTIEILTDLELIIQYSIETHRMVSSQTNKPHTAEQILRRHIKKYLA